MSNLLRVALCLGLIAATFQTLPAAKEASGGVTLEYVAHACFRVISPSGASVLVDPYESRWWLGYDFPDDLPPTDAVLISHPHSDHDGGRSAGRKLPWSPDTLVITPRDLRGR